MRPNGSPDEHDHGSRILKLTEAGVSVGPTAEHDPTPVLAALADAGIDMR